MNTYRVLITTKNNKKHKFLRITAKNSEEAEKKAVSKLPNNNWGIEYTEYWYKGIKRH